MTKIRIAGVPEHFNLPWQLTQELGIFTKKSLEVDWRFYSNGTGAMVKDLADKKLDMAILLSEGAVHAIQNGLKAKLLKMYVKTPLIWGIHAGVNSPLQSIKNLEEHQIAISRFGSGSHLMSAIDAHFRNQTIKKEQFVIVENLNGALEHLNKNPNTLFYWEKYTTKPSVDAGLLKRIGEFVTPWPCFVVVANESFMAKHELEVKKLLDTMIFSCKQFMQSVDSAIPMLTERFGMQEEDAYNWFYCTEWDTSYEISSKMIESIQFMLSKTQNSEITHSPEYFIYQWENLNS